MQLFYAPDIVPPLHTLNEEESKHCIRVLRLQCGGRIHITDGAIYFVAKSPTTIPGAAPCGSSAPKPDSKNCLTR